MLDLIKLRDVSRINRGCLMLLEPVTLSGTHVELVPLSIDHSAALAKAVQDGKLWRLWYTTVPAGGDMEGEILRRLDLQVRGSTLAFAVLDGPGGTPVGMTSYLNVDAATPRLEIGATWYAGRVQRTPLNTEAKLLLLEHAFGPLSCLAVEFRTHFMNAASRRAIERLGAKLDGILRHHVRMKDGTIRDTCVYSVVAPEWPAVRTHLQWQLDRPRP
ncbi:GNAT family protein [uncultured Sphingomonas sp.]|uniref:GNAT family N-acetyltransferase n=1 Tax=uncultured Sphingomonas sp. TaxID=158754 RepID=UPI00260F0124|nr:GNAT family protein [uncultured Sphingomonas sp.]